MSSTNLPTSIPESKDFLQGKHVDAYADDGADLWIKVKTAFAKRLVIAFMGVKALGDLGNLPLPTTISHAIKYLAAYVEHTLAVEDVVRGFIKSTWLPDFSAMVKGASPEPNSSKSHKFNKGLTALQELVNRHLSDHTLHEEEGNRILEELGAIWSDHLLEHLDDIHATQSPRMTPNYGGLIAGLQNSTDRLKSQFDENLWENAWAGHYRGDALFHLETKLQLNVNAIIDPRTKNRTKSRTTDRRTDRTRDRTMSRIIPIVQSSGTGKSRLAEEYLLYFRLLMSL